MSDYVDIGGGGRESTGQEFGDPGGDLSLIVALELKQHVADVIAEGGSDDDERWAHRKPDGRRGRTGSVWHNTGPWAWHRVQRVAKIMPPR